MTFADRQQENAPRWSGRPSLGLADGSLDFCQPIRKGSPAQRPGVRRLRLGWTPSEARESRWSISLRTSETSRNER